MKRTYDRTMFYDNERLQNAEVMIHIYGANKYTGNVTKETEATYTGLISWDIVEGGKEAEEIETETDANSIDENHEYLVLHFNDGTQATFRNSRVDMFIR